MTNPKKKLALVIGSGAVKCAAALGLWQVLNRAGIDIDLYVGCSGGSLYATVMALGLSVEECIEKTKSLWNRRVTERRNWRSLLQALLPGVLGFDEYFGMVDDRPLLRNLEIAFGERTFSETRRPLFVVATNLLDGEQVVISDGKLVDALRASISIPYIWPAWKIGDRTLVDGSLVNPLPIDVAILQGAEIILAMGFESPYPRRIKSISRYAFHINSMMTNNLLRANFAFHNLAHHAEILTILPEFDRPVRLFDTAEFSYVIETGTQAAEEQLPYLERLLETTG
jgi:NTE family protein